LSFSKVEVNIINKIAELKMSTYGFLIFLMTEKEEMQRAERLLDKERDSRKRKKLEELAEWHHQNYMQFLEKPPEWIPWCVRSYLLGHRKQRPSWKTIQREYISRREFFAHRNAKKEKLYKIIAFAFALLAALFVIFKLR